MDLSAHPDVPMVIEHVSTGIAFVVRLAGAR
jgi:hypothetical protein